MGETPERPKLILDCDPGHDDAVAMVLADRLGDLLGITTVSGNASLEDTTRNALAVATVFGIDVPVVSGADRPLIGTSHHAPGTHGASGLDGPELPEQTRPVSGDNAVEFIIETVRSNEGCWLVPVGPMTNVALALATAPDLTNRIAGVSFMGGAAGPGNRTPSAEFNIWHDPHAARIVIDRSPRTIMCGIDVTHQVLVTPEFVDRLRAAEGQGPAFAVAMFDFYLAAYKDVFGQPMGPLHDPCAVAAICLPGAITTDARHVSVEISGELTAGRTVVDDRDAGRRVTAPNVAVGRSADADAILEAVFQALTAP
jgi:inosine-uridine nucleoside N-ribohydrolase